MANTPKFIQIATGQWKGSAGDINHAVYGLSEDGRVYKFYVNEGWTLIRGRNESPANTPRAAAPRQREMIDDDTPF